MFPYRLLPVSIDPVITVGVVRPMAIHPVRILIRAPLPTTGAPDVVVVLPAVVAVDPDETRTRRGANDFDLGCRRRVRQKDGRGRRRNGAGHKEQEPPSDQNRHTSRERFHHTSPSLDGREAIHASGSRPNTGLWWRFRVPPPTRRVAPPRLIVETNVEQPKHDRHAVPLLVTGGLYPTSSTAPRPPSSPLGDGAPGHL